jgi:hypothetical protein
MEEFLMDRGIANGMRYGSAGVVLGIALCWGTSMRGPLAAAQTERAGGSAAQVNPARSPDSARSQPARQSTVGEANGTLALITGATGGQGLTQWLYLIDTKTRAFALYRIDPMSSKGIVKLEASRQYEWDLKLEHYNNQPPEPDAIKATVQTLSRSSQ